MNNERVIIDPSAKIGANVEIGPWTTIGANVEIGEGTRIGSHVTIKGPTKIGKNNHIYQFNSIGEDPQSLHEDKEETALEIGDDNVIREFCTLHRGTVEGGGITRVGSRNFLMAYCHIAHDCHVGSDIIFANNASLSGHVTVDDFATFGGFSAVHQYCQIGSYCFVAGATSVVKDIPPYVLVSGHPAKVYGLNLVGLKRKGFDDEKLAALRKAYSIIYRQGLKIQNALDQLESMLPDHPHIQRLIDALNNSTRGIVR